jgi:hypothetical protein
MDKAFVWLMVFVASQFLLMAFGWLPREHRGYNKP